MSNGSGDPQAAADAVSASDGGVLPLGFSWTLSMPTGGFVDPFSGALAGQMRPGVTEPFWTPLDVLSMSILHDYIPMNPTDPTMPDDGYVLAFMRAMHLVGAEGGMNDQGDADALFTEGPGPILTHGTGSGLHPATYDAIRKCFDSFKAYGPLPEDNERTSGFSWSWDPSLGVTVERHVYFYSVDSSNQETTIGDVNRCVQIIGYSTMQQKWILPNANGETVAHFMDRKADGWKANFDFDRWVLENKPGIFSTMSTIFDVALSISTLGAGAGISGAMIGLVKNLKAAIVQSSNGNGGQFMSSLISTAAQWYAGGGDTMFKDFVASHPDLASKLASVEALTQQVALPLKRAYDAAGAEVNSIQGEASALVAQAKALSNQFPKIDGNYWDMVQTVSGGGVGYNFTSMCKEASSAADLDAIMAKVPSYAQGFVALASAVWGAEDGQYLSLTGGGVQAQLAAPNPILQAMQVHIAVTAPAKPTGPPLSPYLSGQKQVLNPLLEGGTPGTLSPVVVAVAGLGIAYVLGWLKFLL